MSQQKVVPVLKGETYDNLFGALKSKETKATYALRLKLFLAYMNMATPDELLSIDSATTQKKIINYISYLKNEKGQSYSSLTGACAPLKKFFEMNEVLLNWKKIYAYLPDHEKTIEDKPYTHEQIKRLLRFATNRVRVTILLLASSGMRIGALPGLKMKHLTYIERYRLYQIVTYPKTKERYVTFCTPECAAEINNYLDYRRSCGEVIDDESPVIRNVFDRDNPDKAKNPESVSRDSFKITLYGVVTNAGLERKHEVKEDGTIAHRTETMLSHGLRKFFDTNLSRARLHPNKLSALMGHRGGLQHKYDKPEVEELLEEYIKAIDLLTINDENRLKAKVATLEDKDKMIQELSMTLEGLQGQVHSKDKELQDLKKIVERLHNASIFIKATDLPEWKAKAVSLDKFTEDMRTLDEMEKVIKEQVLERAKRLEVIKEQLLEDEKALAAFEEQQKQYKVASKKQKK